MTLSWGYYAQNMKKDSRLILFCEKISLFLNNKTNSLACLSSDHESSNREGKYGGGGWCRKVVTRFLIRYRIRVYWCIQNASSAWEMFHRLVYGVVVFAAPLVLGATCIWCTQGAMLTAVGAAFMLFCAIFAIGRTILYLAVSMSTDELSKTKPKKKVHFCMLICSSASVLWWWLSKIWDFIGVSYRQNGHYVLKSAFTAGKFVILFAMLMQGSLFRLSPMTTA